MYATTLPRSNWLRRASIRLAWYRHMPASRLILFFVFLLRILTFVLRCSYFCNRRTINYLWYDIWYEDNQLYFRRFACNFAYFSEWSQCRDVISASRIRCWYKQIQLFYNTSFSTKYSLIGHRNDSSGKWTACNKVAQLVLTRSQSWEGPVLLFG